MPLFPVQPTRVTMNLDDLIQRADVWRGGDAPPLSGLASGYRALDDLLNGGWPQGALVEILSAYRGIGELRLLLPALAGLTQDKRWLAFVAPPYIPYAPALARAGVRLERVMQVHPRTRTDTLWALEQTLRSGSCGAVLAWPQQADARSLRRLQLAAETGNSLGVLFRQPSAARESSPAAVRLQLAPAATRLSIDVLKRRSGWPVGPIDLEVTHALALSGFSQAGAGNLYSRA